MHYVEVSLTAKTGITSGIKLCVPESLHIRVSHFETVLLRFLRAYFSNLDFSSSPFPLLISADELMKKSASTFHEIRSAKMEEMKF